MTKGILFYFNWILFIIYSKIIFKIERFLYKRIGNKKIKRRLFLTSGNISLINILTILKQFPEENCEDILVIDTMSGKKEFFDINFKAAQMHNFKKIIINIHYRDNRPYFAIMRKNLFYIDEIYAHTKPDYLRYIFPLFKDCKIVMFDEGINSVMEVPSPYNNLVSEVKMMKYCGKIDKIGWNHAKYINPDINIFREIATEITNKYPFDVKLPPESKTILFLGSYWQAFNMTEKEFYEYQDNIIKKLLNNGFSVLYKQHPREVQSREIPQGVIKTNCLLPIELYNIDILGVVSISSSASLQMYNYWNIPGFVSINDKTCNVKEKISGIDLTKLAAKQYVPDIEELLKIDANKYSKEELKTMLKEIFQKKIDSQPMLSENPIILDYYKRYAEKEYAKYKK